MKTRIEVYADVLECEKCDLPSRCFGPVPFHGPTPAKVVVLGEAPGGDEDRQRQPFVGRAGQLMRAALEDTGFDLDAICWINTVSCFPAREDGRGRTPTTSEINACSQNRLDQLELASPEWIIMTGNVPLQAYRPDLRIGKAHGRPFTLNHNTTAPPFCFPVYHPAAALRNPAWEDDLRDDLKLLAQILTEQSSFASARTTCVWCDAPEEEFWHWDDQGIPYCDEHWRNR